MFSIDFSLLVVKSQHCAEKRLGEIFLLFCSAMNTNTEPGGCYSNFFAPPLTPLSSLVDRLSSSLETGEFPVKRPHYKHDNVLYLK